MPDTKLISPGIPNYTLKRNLRLNDKYLSNDGGDEGIRITDAGNVGINTTAIASPYHKLDIFNENVQLDGGTTGYAAGGVFVSTATDMTAAMVGGRLIFDDGTDMGRITEYLNVLAVNVENTATVGSSGDLRAFKIYYAPVTVEVTSTSSILSAGTGLVVGSTTITTDEIDFKAIGDFTIDVAGDILLSADGGNVTMNDGTTTIFDFNVDEPQLKIQDDADTDDYFSIAVGAVGATTITTVDDGGANAHLALNPDGNLTASPAGNITLTATNSSFIGNTFTFGGNDNTCTNYFKYDDNNLCSIIVASTGATTLGTDGSGTTDSHLNIDVDGEIILDSATGITKFYYAGSTADYCSLTVVGGTGATTLATTSAGSDGDITLDSSRKIILDAASTGSGDGIQLLKAGTKIGTFEAHHGYSALFLYENEGASADDLFAIQCYEHGATTIATSDNAATAAHLTLDADGDIILDSHTGITKFYLAGSTTDYASLTVASNGVTTLTTVDDGVGSSGHLTLDVDGDVVLDPFSGITKFYKNGDTDDYLSITVGLSGIATIATADSDGAVGHLTLDADGDINLDAVGANTSGINLKSEGTLFGFFSEHHNGSYFTLYEQGGASTDDYLEVKVEEHGATTLTTVDANAAVAHLILDPDGEINLTPVTEVKSDAPLKIKEAANAVADTAAYGQLWVKTATPNELYFTTDAGDDIQLTSGTSTAGGGGGTSRWHVQTGGYKSSLANANYYFQYYPEAYAWFNTETDPTTLDQETDLYSATWIAPADGTLTRMDVFVKATNATDTIQFYVFKGSISEAGSETASLTQIGVSGDCGIDATNKTFHQIATFSSSNSFSQGDGLWVFIKKDSHSVSTSYYFSITISGEYD